MRHRRKFNHLSRKSAHRKQMLSNMATSLILHKRIRTTLAKAKALRGYVEPLITRSKDDTTHSRRVVFRYLQDKYAVTELFREVSTRVMERPGGYTRIIKLGTRQGDNAEMCLIELVDYNEHLLGTAEVKKAKTTRRGRRGGKKTTEPAETKKESQPAEAKKEETRAATPEEEKPAEGTVSEPPEGKKEEPQAEKPVTEEETPAAEEKKEEPQAEKKVPEGEEKTGERAEEDSDKK